MKQAIYDLRDYDGRGARDFAIVHTNSKVESEVKRAKIIVDMIENAIDRVKKRFHKLERNETPIHTGKMSTRMQPVGSGRSAREAQSGKV